MKNSAYLFLAGIVGAALISGDSSAAANGGTSLFHNQRATFDVEISVDHDDRVYDVGDELRTTVTSTQGGWLYVLHEDAAGNVSVVFPNRFQPTNRIESRTPISIPNADADFRLRVTKPAGRETLTAIVTRRPIEMLERRDLRHSKVTAIDDFHSKSKGLLTEELKTQQEDWSSASIELTVTERRRPIYAQSAVVQKPDRIAVVRVAPERVQKRNQRTMIVVGIGPGFLDAGIRALRAAHHDAREFAAVMHQYGQIDHCILLLNDQATKQQIQRAFEEAVRVTEADGEIIIYMSTHGIRLAALNRADEPDGFDEAIVCADSRLPVIGTNRQTVIFDHELADWFENFGDRRAVLILDMCHAGGFASKSVGSLAAGLIDDTERRLQKMDAAKNIKRLETAILASSQEDELSFERRSGFASVLTYELVQLIKSSNGPVGIRQAAQYVSPRVRAYADHAFATNQRPDFVDRLTKTVLLRTH